MSYIYLDNAATTQVSESAAKVMLHYAREEFYNPSAGYAPALEVRKQIKRSANEIAGILGASGEEIIFTSCATESNNHAFSCGIKNKKGNVRVPSTIVRLSFLKKPFPFLLIIYYKVHL